MITDQDCQTYLRHQSVYLFQFDLPKDSDSTIELDRNPSWSNQRYGLWPTITIENWSRKELTQLELTVN